MYIPEDIRQNPTPYALGEYIISPEHSNNLALQQWIKNLQFEKHESDANRMQLHSRKRNHLYSFHLPAVDKDIVLKVSQISRHYRWYRRLNLMLVSLFKNYSLNAYYGGIALNKIDVNSPKVLAHWTCKHSAQTKKSYLLYEKVNASMAVFDLCKQLCQNNQNAELIIIGISQSLAKIIRKLHANNIRHGDPHAGNFLLTSPISNIQKITLDSVREMNFTLIDLDKVQFAHNENRWKKKLLNIRCIRRFSVPNIDASQCLELYLGRNASILEKTILKFWMRGGFNIYKWFKITKKRH